MRMRIDVTQADTISEIEHNEGFFPIAEEDWYFPVSGPKLAACQLLIEKKHYTRSVPAGKSHYFYWRGVLVVFSIPANMHIGRYILKRPCVCWELSRIWAKDGHRKNTLTEAIAKAIRGLRRAEPSIEVLVSFADPNVGHEGFVYKAASWVYTGKSEDPRGYTKDGEFFPRRKFHSGRKCMTKAEIKALGYREVVREGKHRFVKGLTRRASTEIRTIWQQPN